MEVASNTNLLLMKHYSIYHPAIECSCGLQAIITAVIISIFKEDNVFSMNANLPYGPPLNTGID